MDKQTAPFPKFESMEQLIADKHYNQFIKEEIVKTQKRRADLLKENPGIEFKKCPLDILERDNNFAAPYLSAQFLLINGKESTLPSAVRDYISSIVLTSFKRTFAYYHEEQNKIALLSTTNNN